jgi:WD40 repeat protein
MSEEAENDPSIKRLICSLRNHAYPVTCLRFSKCGNFLASGGDDRAIFLWKRFVSSDISSWRLFGQLHGHIADIQDIVWEKNSKMLASCSVDNKVIIWSLDKMAKIKELTEHTDWVRGLAWDPLGKYLASFGADGVLCIWQTSNWSLLKKITNYFIQGQIARNYQSSLNRQVYFTRMDWNPDGTYLVASFSMDQNNIYASPVFSRDTWKKLVTFIGHRFPTTATRCSPRLFRSASDETVLYSPCAVGSMDSSVSVWVPFETRPIAVFEHFFEGTVVDIAWNVDGKSFLACSIDGSIGYFRFGKNDLKGECITDSEQREHIKRISGQIRIELPDAAGLADSSDMYLDTNDIPVSRAKRKNASLSELPDFNDFEANNSEVSMAPSHNRDALTSRLKGKKAGRSERLTTENISTVHISNKYPEDLFSELIPPSFGKKEFTFTLRDHESDQTSFDIFPDFIKNHLELSVLVDDRKGKSDMFSEYSLIALLEKDSKRWIEEIPGRVVVGCGNEHSVIVGTKDRFMYFLSAETGMRVFPGVKLPSIPVSMHLYGYKLLVLCGDGDIRVWECRDMRLESKCSLRDLADALEKNQKSKIASVYLDKSFNICAIVSGNCFMYNSSLESWICLKDSRYFKSEYAFDSEAKGLAEDSVRIGQNLTALSQTPRAIQVLQNASYLENELAVALSLNLAESYRNALISYVQCDFLLDSFQKA